MSKIITGKCFNVSLFRTKENAEFLSLQLHTDDNIVWKFKLGCLWDKVYKINILDVMRAERVSIRTKLDSNRKNKVR